MSLDDKDPTPLKVLVLMRALSSDGNPSGYTHNNTLMRHYSEKVLYETCSRGLIMWEGNGAVVTQKGWDLLTKESPLPHQLRTAAGEAKPRWKKILAPLLGEL